MCISSRSTSPLDDFSRTSAQRVVRRDMSKLGRPKAEVVVTESERAELMRLTKRARVNRTVAFRARIVFACADAPDHAVVRRLRTTKSTVAKWRLRFVARRLEGL
jgi:hypothetical protein